MVHDELQVPPNDEAAEKAVLGALLLLGRQPEAKAREMERAVLAGLRPSDFYGKAYGIVFRTMQRMIQAGERPDLVTLRNALGTDLESAGDTAGLMELLDAVPSATNALHYAGIMREHACRRELIAACLTVQDESFRQSDVSEAVDALLGVTDGIRDRMTPELRLQSMGEVLDAIDDEMARPKAPPLLTGFNAIDDALGGIMPGQLIVLGARPSMGKTTLALNLLANVCRQDRRGVMLSLETERSEIVKTLLALHGGIPRWKLKPRYVSAINEVDRMRHAEAKETVSGLRLDILDDKRAYRQPARLDLEIRRMHRKSPIDLLVVDHFHLLDHGSGRERLDTQMGRTSQLFQGLAKETGIPIIVLAQLNRTIEQDARAPRLSDLRECGKLEEDADAALFLSPDPDDRSRHRNRVVVNIAKNKLGPCGRLLLYRDPDSLKYSELVEGVGSHGG